MSDITTTASSEKVIQPLLGSTKQQKKPSLKEVPLEENLYTGSTEPIHPEHLEQIKQELANHASSKQIQHQSEQVRKHTAVIKEFSKKDLEQIKQELVHLPPKQLQDLINQLKSNLSQLQASIIELKKQKKIDPEKADLFLDAINDFSSKDLYNLSKDDQAKLSNTLNTLKQKVTEFIHKKEIEPEIGNILILFLAFAKAQMDQNDKAMLAGIQQTKVKTTQLELQAEKQKDIAGQSTQGKHVNVTYAIGWIALAVFLNVALAFFTGGTSLLIEGVVGGLIGAASVGAAAGVAASNPDASGIGGITDEGPNLPLMNKLQSLLAYCNTQTQKLSSQLGSTEKMFVENPSDRSSQLGQQAGQAITEMGEIMKSR